MRNFNRIIGFISVSFVLLFIAKINKTELYTAYFRTIADVEIRNSHALRMEGVVHAASADLVGDLQVEQAHSAGDLASSAPMPQPQAVCTTEEVAALPASPHIMQPCIPQTSPRAPDFRA
jgi:hypothetical protein